MKQFAFLDDWNDGEDKDSKTYQSHDFVREMNKAHDYVE